MLESPQQAPGRDKMDGSVRKKSSVMSLWFFFFFWGGGSVFWFLFLYVLKGLGKTGLLFSSFAPCIVAAGRRPESQDQAQGRT